MGVANSTRVRLICPGCDEPRATLLKQRTHHLRAAMTIRCMLTAGGLMTECPRPSIRIAIVPQARTAGHFLAHGMPYSARVVSSTCCPAGSDDSARDWFLRRMKSSSVNRTNNIAKACR
jgi:hypothetical protein